MSKKQNKLIFMACCTALLLSTGTAKAIGLKFSNPQPHQKIKAGNQEIHLIYDHAVIWSMLYLGRKLNKV